MKLEIPIQITAADSIKRTISGRIVSFNETANASTGKVMFTDGSLVPTPVKLNLEHDGTRPIGKTLSMDFSDGNSAIDGVFKIANTNAGSDALVEAQDGLRDGFSVEVMANEFTYSNDGTMVVSSGEIVGVALVTNPAFKSARVTDVAATQASPETSDNKSEEPPKEGDEVSDPIVINEAPAVETVEASRNIKATGIPVAYTAPRLEFTPAKYLENKIRAALGNEDARQFILAAADTTDNAGLVPTRQLTEVINGLANKTRSNIDAISRGVLPDSGMSFEIPKITVLPGVGTIAEAGAPTETDQNSAFVTVSILKAAGQQNFSVELLDRSNPLFVTELMSNLAAQYAKITDTAVNAALIAGASADGTTIVTYPTAAELLGVVARGAASVLNGTQDFARNIIMNTSQWSNVMTLNDGGRPIYNAQVPSNAGGSVAVNSIRGNVAGLNLFVTANTAATTDTDGSILIVNPEAYTYYESPTYELRADVIASGQVNIMMYGYYAIATKLAAGAFKNNKA